VLSDEQNCTMRIVAVLMDSSERKEAKRELEAARDYLRAVTDTMDESMYTLDNEGRVQYINPTAERLLGWSSGELLGEHMHEITHSRRADGSTHAAFECPILVASREGRVVEVADDVFVRRDGTMMPVSYTALPFSAATGIEGCVVIFEDITERKAEERRVAEDREKLAWAARLREALAEDRLELYSQPIVDCASGEVVQQELLLRLNDPELGVVAPGEFLPVAEELGLIGEVDRWVVRRAAEIAVEYGNVQLNLSARSVGNHHFVDQIAHAIQQAGADPSRMLFEITETAVVGDEQAARSFLERLHGLGCKVALDDFGTGYGSFTYLKQLPIDVLKIDAEFVKDLAVDPASRSVVEAVVSLAESFGLSTVGEGVEDQRTFEMLCALGVEHAQGYHLGRPRPLDEDSPRPCMPAAIARAPRPHRTLNSAAAPARR
jgi:PAS domain S-box-containing protein